MISPLPERAVELDDAETLQPQDELAPEGGLDWPPILMLALLLVVVIGTAMVLRCG